MDDARLAERTRADECAGGWRSDAPSVEMGLVRVLVLFRFCAPSSLCAFKLCSPTDAKSSPGSTSEVFECDCACQ